MLPEATLYESRFDKLISVPESVLNQAKFRGYRLSTVSTLCEESYNLQYVRSKGLIPKNVDRRNMSLNLKSRDYDCSYALGNRIIELSSAVSGQFVGYISFEFDHDDHSEIEITTLAVSREYQKQGVGRFLMNCCKRFAESKGVEKLVVDSLPESIGFYNKLGMNIFKDNMLELKLDPKINHRSPSPYLNLEIKDQLKQKSPLNYLFKIV